LWNRLTILPGEKEGKGLDTKFQNGFEHSAFEIRVIRVKAELARSKRQELNTWQRTCKMARGF
jgi:hypothetical protein